MRRFYMTYALLAVLSAAFTLGWTTEGPPVGDTTTVTRGDVVYVDEGSTIQIYRVDGEEFELAMSIETDQSTAHDTRRTRRKRDRDHSFTCSCTQTHDHDRHHHHDPCDPCHNAVFVVSGSTLTYVYERSTVVSLDISTPDSPREVSRVDVGWDVESIELVDGAVILVGSQERQALDTIENR